MTRSRFSGWLGVACLAIALLAGCATTDAGRPAPAPPPVVSAPPAAAPTPRADEAPARAPAPGTVFESADFVVSFPVAGETTESLAARFLGDPTKAWMIAEYNDGRGIEAGQEVIIPKRPWSPSGVYPSGYQVVPILAYHNIGPEARGRLIIAARTFEEQMRYLKAQGYRVVSLEAFMEFASLRRQLPGRSVVLTFDDGYKSFLQYAYPVLRELGFTATLFVYTDYVGAGRNSLSWEELARLADEGFEIGAHSKTHTDLRRKAGEADATFARRMQAELGQTLFEKHLGRPVRSFAYPFGAADSDVVTKVKDAGYHYAFTVRRDGNPSFTPRFLVNRSQIYAEMSLEEFARNLATFHQEAIR
jgi:peptidoglycan/xylan/chitin deacetylase (PgdA/CDA1 family)